MQQFVHIICVIILMASLWLGSVSLFGHLGDNIRRGCRFYLPVGLSTEKYSTPSLKIVLIV